MAQGWGRRCGGADPLGEFGVVQEGHQISVAVDVFEF